MAMMGVNIYETRQYISKNEPDKDNPSIFILGILDPNIRAHIDDQTTQMEFSAGGPQEKAKANIAIGKRSLLAVKFGLKGLENFIDPQAKKPVVFDKISVSIGGKNYDAVSDPILALLGNELRNELSEEILKENSLTEEQKKN
jgi:hypothetical protein